MKLADTTPLSATGATLEAWAEGDSTFDLFCEHPAATEASELERAGVRPAIMTAERCLVWGFRYRPVWREHSSSEFPVLITGSSAADDRRSTILAGIRCALIAENRVGAFRLSELERVRRLAEHIGAGESAWLELAPLLSTDADPGPLIDRFRDLPEVLKEAVNREQIDLRTAEAIPADLAGAAGRFLPALGALSFSNRRQALRMVVELLRGGADGDCLLQETSLQSRPNVIPFLRRRRYPALTDLERRFDTVRRGVLSGTGVSMAPPDNFEGDRFQVSFTFRTREELRTRLNATERLKDEMDELLDLLF